GSGWPRQAPAHPSCTACFPCCASFSFALEDHAALHRADRLAHAAAAALLRIDHGTLLPQLDGVVAAVAAGDVAAVAADARLGVDGGYLPDLAVEQLMVGKRAEAPAHHGRDR